MLRAGRWFRHLESPPAPETTLIGPIIGWRGNGAARIVLGMPGRSEQWLECRLEAPEGGSRTLRAEPGHGLFRVFVFDFDALEPGRVHRYSFSALDGPLDLDGLEREDLCFRAPGPFSAGDSLLLLSCHNPYVTERGSAEDGWALWPLLLDRLEADASIRCLVLGGDQLYCDDVESERLASLRGAGADPAVRDDLRRRFIAQYQLYWGKRIYRRVLARVPSLAMWDDHDITDGWGSRPESLDGSGRIRDHWRAYFEIAREAFSAYQASRNPEPLPGCPPGTFSTVADLGTTRLWLLDLRSERNAAAGRLWGDEQEGAFRRSLLDCPTTVEAALVLTPVIAFRTNFADDRRLSAMAQALFRATFWLENHRELRNALVPLRWAAWLLVVAAVVLDALLAHWPLLSFLGLGLVAAVLTLPELLLRVPELPNLSDDLVDGLSSERNRPTLVRLLRLLFDWKRSRGAAVTLLAGDIHLGGISEIIETRAGEVATIPQLVSSPVSHAPMPKAAAGFSTTTSEMVVEEEPERRLFARNVFYLSRRNFARVLPGRLGKPSAGAPYELHLEGHALPLAIPERFWTEFVMKTAEGGHS